MLNFCTFVFCLFLEIKCLLLSLMGSGLGNDLSSSENIIPKNEADDQTIFSPFQPILIFKSSTSSALFLDVNGVEAVLGVN